MIKIPLKAFETKDEGGKSVTPSVGDTVPLDAFTGEVKSVDGDSVVVDLKEYNGQPVEYAEHDDGDEEEGDPDQEKESLLKMMESKTED